MGQITFNCGHTVCYMKGDKAPKRSPVCKYHKEVDKKVEKELKAKAKKVDKITEVEEDKTFKDAENEVKKNVPEGAFCVMDIANGVKVQTCFDNAGHVISAGAERLTSTVGIIPDDKSLAGFIDHTLLKPDATADKIAQLCFEAKKYHFASVCVNPIKCN